MRLLLRYVPVVICVAALSAMFLAMSIMRPPHACGPFQIFRQYRASQSPLCQNKKTGSESSVGSPEATS